MKQIDRYLEVLGTKDFSATTLANYRARLLLFSGRVGVDCEAELNARVLSRYTRSLLERNLSRRPFAPIRPR